MAMSQVEANSKASSKAEVIEIPSSPVSTKHISDSIAAREVADPPAGQPTTSVQFRFPDGKKLVKKFLKSDVVR
jgi:hypothetical protein